MCMALGRLLEYWIEHVAMGHFKSKWYSQLAYSTVECHALQLIILELLATVDQPLAHCMLVRLWGIVVLNDSWCVNLHSGDCFFFFGGGGGVVLIFIFSTLYIYIFLVFFLHK